MAPAVAASFVLSFSLVTHVASVQEYGEDGVPREEVADGLIRHDSLSGACLTRSQAFRHITAAVAESILFDANYRRLKRLNL
jgi:hypothetical protein